MLRKEETVMMKLSTNTKLETVYTIQNNATKGRAFSCRGVALNHKNSVNYFRTGQKKAAQ